MTTLEYWLEADESGKIEIGLPEDFPKGRLHILVMSEPAPISDETTWTDEEIAHILKPRDPSQKPLTGAEILAILAQSQTPSIWEDAPSGAEWVNQQRATRRKRRG